MLYHWKQNNPISYKRGKKNEFFNLKRQKHKEPETTLELLTR